jgi:hypothetical protein
LTEAKHARVLVVEEIGNALINRDADAPLCCCCSVPLSKKWVTSVPALSQKLEPLTFNHVVEGSSPSALTKKPLSRSHFLKSIYLLAFVFSK